MPKASAVSAELRMFADHLDTNPNAIIPKPSIFLSANTKDEFTSIGRLMPRPISKSVDDEGKQYASRVLRHTTDSIHIWASVPQYLTCTLITPAQPAVYECDPILSLDEEAELENA